ncbi:hypothetical protein F5Y17DRAFT_417296 [Xylariaceae sp. FL0594]|nr:hypothetical protein F5Y17DRAFT_417296 [Xylariaceae sp. FL0594]
MHARYLDTPGGVRPFGHGMDDLPVPGWAQPAQRVSSLPCNKEEDKGYDSAKPSTSISTSKTRPASSSPNRGCPPTPGQEKATLNRNVTADDDEEPKVVHHHHHHQVQHRHGQCRDKTRCPLCRAGAPHSLGGYGTIERSLRLSPSRDHCHCERQNPDKNENEEEHDSHPWSTMTCKLKTTYSKHISGLLSNWKTSAADWTISVYDNIIKSAVGCCCGGGGQDQDGAGYDDDERESLLQQSAYQVSAMRTTIIHGFDYMQGRKVQVSRAPVIWLG